MERQYIFERVNVLTIIGLAKVKISFAGERAAVTVMGVLDDVTVTEADACITVERHLDKSKFPDLRYDDLSERMTVLFASDRKKSLLAHTQLYDVDTQSTAEITLPPGTHIETMQVGELTIQ